MANWQYGKLTFSIVVSRDESRGYFCALIRRAQSQLAMWQSERSAGQCLEPFPLYLPEAPWRGDDVAMLLEKAVFYPLKSWFLLLPIWRGDDVGWRCYSSTSCSPPGV